MTRENEPSIDVRSCRSSIVPFKKNRHVKRPQPDGLQPPHTDGGLALTFGTLLSSQGATAHLRKTLALLRGNLSSLQLGHRTVNVVAPHEAAAASRPRRSFDPAPRRLQWAGPSGPCPRRSGVA
jgi:hypothetical protein